MDKWGTLQPDGVSDFINFDRSDDSWRYDENNRESMASKQAEGVAYLWNLLNTKGLAILADEVGMGKTFQALGVISLLWKMKPSAKILVMAPNRDICRHWVNEYRTFLRHHYRQVDHSVRNVADGGPVHDPVLCWNLKTLEEKVAEGWGHIYFTTIHSLSGLVEDKTVNEKGKAAAKAGRKFRERLLVKLGDQGFDLLVIDEAHYFRNKEGGSQRAHAAQTFFGEGEDPLAKKVLLMTATPSHSGLKDIVNIISYFKQLDQDVVHSPSDVLKAYALRRLRLMEGQGGDFHSKYNYREERALPVDFSDDPSAELFFALYQKKLAEELQEGKSGRRFLYGYLEGFESVGVREAEQDTSSALDDRDESDTKRESFRKAPDTELLERLTASYAQVMGGFPEHPKYSALVKQFTPPQMFKGNRDLHEDKHLVFVRRIPSVREMTQRVNAAYDEVMMAYLLSAWDLTLDDPVVQKWKRGGYRRKEFNALIQRAASISEDDVVIDDEVPNTDEDDAQVEDDSRLGSKVADLFVVKKLKGAEREGDVERTDCSNVRLRFRKPDSLFALLLEPARDYQSEPYLGYYKNDGKRILRDLYAPAAMDTRLKEQFSHAALTIEQSHDAKYEQSAFDRPLTTLWGLVFHQLSEDYQEKIYAWVAKDSGIVENFSNYLQAGMLFASPVIVELYVWFSGFNRINGNKDVQKKYLAFIEYIKPKLSDSLYLEYFKEALDSFDVLCEKIVDHELSDWRKDWSSITRLQNPAWYASGESSNRQRLIMGFNSPFYPNVLIATSVFQEGVNLHLQCRKVHHYGIAWTPGDNEQRVGRVDRLFGRVNKQLLKGENSQLDIQYPYLAGSFDEDQVGAFIYNKAKVEEEMDRCLHREFSKEIQTNSERIDWKQYLRVPALDKTYTDPYPATFNSSNNQSAFRPYVNHSDEEMLNYLRTTLLSTLEKDSLYKVTNIEGEVRDGLLFLLDPKLQYQDAERRQPIIVERNFSSRFSGLVDGTVYFITFKSPICSRKSFYAHQLTMVRTQDVFNSASDRFPLVQLAIDEDTTHSNFYLHMKVDLPIFVAGGKLKYFSSDEVETAYKQLRDFSDLFEMSLFDDEQDLRKNDLKIASRLKEYSLPDEVASVDSTRAERSPLRPKWNLIDSATGPVIQLNYGKKVKILTEKNIGDDGGKIIEYCLKLNHEFPFLNFEAKNNQLNVRLSFPGEDTQEEEMVLLEKWYDHIVQYGFQ